MIWQGAASANQSRVALHQPFTAAGRKASSASPMMTPRARTRAASKERIMAMQIDETELEDMRDDALALAKGGARPLGSRPSGSGDRRPARRGGPRSLGLGAGAGGVRHRRHRTSKGLMPVVGPVAERFTRSGREPPRGLGGNRIADNEKTRASRPGFFVPCICRGGSKPNAIHQTPVIKAERFRAVLIGYVKK